MQGPSAFTILEAQTIIISGPVSNSGLFEYSGAAGPGATLLLAIVPPGRTTDPFGNTVSGSSILIQGSTITASGGIFRTAAAAPLIQLDGPHNAFLAYNASSQLTETIAPAATNDGLGNSVAQGFTAYLGSARTTYVNMRAGAITFNDTLHDAFAPGQAGLATVTGINDSLTLLSPLVVSTDFQSVFSLQRGATPGPAHAIVANSDLIVQTDTTPAVPANGFSLHSNGGQAGVIHSKDHTDYIFGHVNTFITSDQTINSTTFSFVAGGPVPIGAGTYRVRSVLTCQQVTAAVADNFRLGFTGTISQVRTTGRFYALSGTGESIFGISPTANNGLLATPAFAVNVIYVVEVDAIIVTTSTGNIGMQAAESAAGDTFSVLALSFFHIEPV